MGVVDQLVLQRGTQVLVKLQQGPQQAPLQRCGEGSSAAGSGHGPAVLLWPPASPSLCPGSAYPRSPCLAQAGTCPGPPKGALAGPR